jgi:hypothetical protein
LGTTLAFLDLFSKHPQKPVIHGTKVLVCALDAKFDELVKNDSNIYSQYYPLTTSSVFATINELLGEIKRRYDVVHLFVDVSPAGVITDRAGTDLVGTSLIQKCCESDVKLLWIASDNKADGYIQGFKGSSKPINLVMTINRDAPKFSNFLGALLSRMSSGKTMPTAWAEISPQTSRDPRHTELPATIFSAGRGAVILR